MRRGRRLRRRYGRSGRSYCAGSGLGVRGLHETGRGQVQCPHCQRLLWPDENPSPPPYMVLPRHVEKEIGR